MRKALIAIGLLILIAICTAQIANVTGDISCTASTSCTVTAINGTSFSLPVSVANGGTALASGTSGGVLGYTASGTLASSAAGTANDVMKWGGAGATPGDAGFLATNVVRKDSTNTMAASATIDASTNAAIISNAIGGDAQVSTSDTLTGSVLGANTQGYFLTHVTTLGATSANTIDGTHRGSHLIMQFDYTATATVPTFQHALFVCPLANFSSSTTAPCSSGQATLWASSTQTPGATASTYSYEEFYITAAATNGTLNVTRSIVSGGSLGSNPGTTPTAVACGTTCTGTAYVLYVGEKFGSNAASNLVTLISLYAPYIH